MNEQFQLQNPPSNSDAVFDKSEKQELALEYLRDNVTSELGYGGGAHGGKTILGCYWIITSSQKYPDTRWLLGRQQLVDLKKTTMDTFVETLSLLGLTLDDLGRYDKQLGVLYCWNGSEILLYDLKYKPTDPLYSRFGGLNITGAYIDEANECDARAIQIIRTRVGRRMNKEYGLLGKVLETFNPSDNHVYTRYYKPWKDGKLPDNKKFIQALPTDNPWTPKEYIAELERADEITKQRLLYGNFEYANDDLALFKTNDLIDMFNNVGFGKSKTRYITCDVARQGRDNTVMFIWEGWRVIAVKTYSKLKTTETVQKLKELRKDYNVKLTNILVDEAGVGGGVVDQLDCIGFIGGSSPIYDEEEDMDENGKIKKKNYLNLRTQCYDLIAERVRDGKILIDIKNSKFQEDLKEELRAVKYRDVGRDAKIKITLKDDIKKNIGRSPDLADAFSMRMYFKLDQESIPLVGVI